MRQIGLKNTINRFNTKDTNLYVITTKPYNLNNPS